MGPAVQLLDPSTSVVLRSSDRMPECAGEAPSGIQTGLMRSSRRCPSIFPTHVPFKPLAFGVLRVGADRPPSETPARPVRKSAEVFEKGSRLGGWCRKRSSRFRPSDVPIPSDAPSKKAFPFGNMDRYGDGWKGEVPAREQSVCGPLILMRDFRSGIWTSLTPKRSVKRSVRRGSG